MEWLLVLIFLMLMLPMLQNLIRKVMLSRENEEENQTEFGEGMGQHPAIVECTRNTKLQALKEDSWK